MTGRVDGEDCRDEGREGKGRDGGTRSESERTAAEETDRRDAVVGEIDRLAKRAEREKRKQATA